MRWGKVEVGSEVTGRPKRRRTETTRRDASAGGSGSGSGSQPTAAASDTLEDPDEQSLSDVVVTGWNGMNVRCVRWAGGVEWRGGGR